MSSDEESEVEDHSADKQEDLDDFGGGVSENEGGVNVNVVQVSTSKTDFAPSGLF
jgi:hypothetical protein